MDADLLFLFSLFSFMSLYPLFPQTQRIYFFFCLPLLRKHTSNFEPIFFLLRHVNQSCEKKQQQQQGWRGSMEELRIRTVAVALRFFFPCCFTRFSITPSREVSGGGGEGEVHLVELLCLCAVRSPTCCTQQQKKKRKKKGGEKRSSSQSVSWWRELFCGASL